MKRVKKTIKPYPMLDQPITMEEIKKTLHGTKINKSPDGTPIAVIKTSGPRMLTFLHELLNMTYSAEWNVSEICPIFKNEDDPRDCKNSDVSLMGHIGKMYERILER